MEFVGVRYLDFNEFVGRVHLCGWGSLPTSKFLNLLLVCGGVGVLGDRLGGEYLILHCVGTA